MGIKVALHHRTEYRYEKPVAFGPQLIQLRPAPHCRTAILSYALGVTPADHLLNWQFDPLGNHLARVILPGKTDEFAVDVDLMVDLAAYNPFAFFVEPSFAVYPFKFAPELAELLEPYLTPEPVGSLLGKWLLSVPVESRDTVSLLIDLNRRVRDEIGYLARLEPGIQSCEETLASGSGSCRDSSWLLVQIFRNLGIAARFVSGYLIQLAAAEPAVDEPNAPKVDSADLHAWVEVYLPGAGWIGLDPTSGLLAAEGHIPLVCTPSASAAAPIGGTVEPAAVRFTHTMTLRRVDEEPSLTKPYSDEDWAKVREVAHQIDRDLVAQDVRLTMGGEPTYVGIDDPESMQWNLEALGPLKRTRGLALIRRLRARTAPGAMLLFGQGKWYPGEPLPRWAFHCVSRNDGVPVWENGELIGTEEQAAEYGVGDSLRFAEALARRLEVTTENVLAAFNSGDDESEPVGYILPLRRRQPAGKLAWSSQLWFPRPERLLLSPGDSPIGFRIPTEAMPWVAPDEIEYELETGPDGEAIADQVKLPVGPARRPDLFAKEPAPDTLPALAGDAATAKVLMRPSLCVEVREARMHVFLPFTSVASDYLELVAAIEDTCAYLGIPVWLEGYTPPADGRLRTFSLTPDPGVLEVNLPPTADWDELEELNAILAEEAHGTRLIAGKFAYDGSHLATGGGSHIVIGSTSFDNSPLLRRPDLLRSMVSFWQNHPSLSYLFSGLYVGPTSQYPRVDEARVDALYELEVTFSQMGRLEGTCPPSTLDGLFRNLLVDVTGNTHRAEFCIDKLCPPYGQGLPLGLLELRAFEMAPHYRMGLTQMLLVRALVCVFWRQPYTGSLMRWGTALHDRFMLPHFVAQDFGDVLAYLREAGYEFDERWFGSQVEFRFPKIGSVSADGVEMELRAALEPWNVLAEETSSGRTGRSVDSSLERMQVKLTGVTTPGRYAVTCNGRRVPLTATGAAGESIAGIRYRARMLSAALHPTIPVHTPLVFELIDVWKGYAIGRCTYFAGRPDGSLYQGRPANAKEARERRMQRFQVSQPALERVTVPAEEHNPVFPMTLDLRWAGSGSTQGGGPAGEVSA